MLTTNEIIKAVNNISHSLHAACLSDSKKYSPKADFDAWNAAINHDIGRSVSAVVRLEKRCSSNTAKKIDTFMHDLPIDYGVHCADPVKYAEAQGWSYIGAVDGVFAPLCRMLEVSQQKRLQTFARLGA